MVNCAIFADTGFEPTYVYKHLEWLKNELSFPIYIVKSKDEQTNKGILEHTLKTIKGTAEAYNAPPFFSNKGLIRRQCKHHYKIFPIRLKIRELLGLKKHQRCPTKDKDYFVYQYIGISKDEMNRMTINRDKYIKNIYPLVEKNITRKDCINWLKNNNYPIVKKSACMFCPYHDNDTWKDMKKNRPKDFAMVVKIDEKLRNSKSKKYPFDRKLYMHWSLKPLKNINFDKPIKDPRTKKRTFNDECEGMCGV